MSKDTPDVALAGVPQVASSSLFGLAAYTFINISAKGVGDDVSIGASAAVMAAHPAGAIGNKPRAAA